MASLNQHEHTRINLFMWNERSASIGLLHLEQKNQTNMHICVYNCSSAYRGVPLARVIQLIQPTADRVAQHLEIISKNFQFSTRRTRILTGFVIYYLVLIVNPMGRILVRWKFFRNHLEMLCHPICNWLYERRTTNMNTLTFTYLRIMKGLHP